MGLHALRLRSTVPELTGPSAHFLGFIGAEPDTGQFRPYLDDSPRDEQLNFETWWNESIFRLPKTNEMITRRDLVLVAANKDGGAHVDIERPSYYDRLENGLGIQLEVGLRDGSTRRLVSLSLANLAQLRQIGHEILTSQELIAIAKT